MSEATQLKPVPSRTESDSMGQIEVPSTAIRARRPRVP